MQLRKTMFLGLLALLLISRCALFSDKEVVTISPLPKYKNKFEPKIIWRRAIGRESGDFYYNLYPVCLDGIVFAADRHGIVQSLDINNGKKIWSTDLAINTGFFSRKRSVQLSSGITAAGNRIYLGSDLSKIYALDANNGSIAWETTVVGEALSTPVVSGGLVLIHTSNGMLQALNEQDGAVKWILNLDVPTLSIRGESAPTPAFGAIIIGGDNGVVSAVMLDQGEIIWQNRISHPIGATEISRINDIQTTPVVVDGVVYAIAYNGNLTSLDLISGNIIWSRQIGSITNLLVDNGKIYLVDQHDRVISVNSRNGMTLWSQSDLLYRKLTSPVLYKNYIVTGDSEGYLHWINACDGSLVAQKKIDSTGFFTPPIVYGDKLIIQAKNGDVYAIK